VTNRYLLNLATQPFRPYRAANALLFVVLVLILSFVGWQLTQLSNFASQSAEFVTVENAVRAEWNELGNRIERLERQLGGPDTQIQVDQLAFINQIVEQKSFSWSKLLSVIENAIPAGVYLIGLKPHFDDSGFLRVEMEVRSKTVQDVSHFIMDLERTRVFEDVIVSIEDHEIEGGFTEIAVSMNAVYLPTEETKPAEIR